MVFLDVLKVMFACTSFTSKDQGKSNYASYEPFEVILRSIQIIFSVLVLGENLQNGFQRAKWGLRVLLMVADNIIKLAKIFHKSSSEECVRLNEWVPFKITELSISIPLWAAWTGSRATEGNPSAHTVNAES